MASMGPYGPVLACLALCAFSFTTVLAASQCNVTLDGCSKGYTSRLATVQLRSSLQDNYCLDNPKGSTLDGAQMIMFTCWKNQTENQLWTLDLSVPSTKIVQKASQKCLSYEDSTLKNNTKVIQTDCANAPYWSIKADGTVRLAAHPTWCMDVEKGGLTNGTSMVLWSCHSQPNQVFKWPASNCGACAPGLVDLRGAYSSLSPSYSDTLTSLDNRTGLIAMVDRALASLLQKAVDAVTCRVHIPQHSGDEIKKFSNTACQALTLDSATHYYAVTLNKPQTCVAFDSCTYAITAKVAGAEVTIPLGKTTELTGKATVGLDLLKLSPQGYLFHTTKDMLWNLQDGDLNSFKQVSASGGIWIDGRVQLSLSAATFSVGMDSAVKFLLGLHKVDGKTNMDIVAEGVGSGPLIMFHGQKIQLPGKSISTTMYWKWNVPRTFKLQYRFTGNFKLADVITKSADLKKIVSNLLSVTDVGVYADIYADSDIWGVSMRLNSAVPVNFLNKLKWIKKKLGIPDSLKAGGSLVIVGRPGVVSAKVAFTYQGKTEWQYTLCKVDKDCVDKGTKCTIEDVATGERICTST